MSQSNGPANSHFDVLIVGAGISGIGAAYELKDQCPEKSFAMLDAMSDFGGTWRSHNYPGIRSDSDLFTFGFRFKPWRGAPIANGAEILEYLGEVIEEHDLGPHIKYNHKIMRAEWNTDAGLWRVFVEKTGSGERLEYTCNFLWMCQGYYRHSHGYTPEWDGMEDFSGEIIHPQTWPKDTEYKNKKVVVIGSGATAATLVPAIANDTAHVTMLQRSPTFFSPMRNSNTLADTLRELQIDEHWIHEIVRRKIVVDQREFLNRSLEDPESVREDLMRALRKHLPQDVIDEHFTPKYRPWQQRIAVVPEGDLFKSVTSGNASVVTDHIDRFTKNGILLKSGREIEADIIVTATGFELSVFGGIDFEVDGTSVDFADTMTYRGMMFTSIPNFAWIMGYFRAASWTLRVDLVGDFVCNLLKNMDRRGANRVSVELNEKEKDMARLPWIDDRLFNPGYMMRSQHLLPKRGEHPQWGHSQDYWADLDEYPNINLDSEPFEYQ